MKIFTTRILSAATMLAAIPISASAGYGNGKPFDLANYRYRIDSSSVFHNNHTKSIEKINRLTAGSTSAKAQEFKNPDPIASLPPANITGDIDAPNGERWFYIGEFDYTEIPPHDNIAFTDYILQTYKFTIYNTNMQIIGVIKDKMEYAENEVRVPLCEITPVATRNFFNTDDKIELIVGVAVNIEEGGNNYRSLIYSLDGEKDAEGYDKPIQVWDSLVGDVIEGPSDDGSDNFFITFTDQDIDESIGDETFWDFLLSQRAIIKTYGKALDASGPRLLLDTAIPLIQLPGDQENVPAMISMRRGDDIYLCISYYKDPFYNKYENPMTDDMTQREGNSLVIDLYKATEKEIAISTSSTIPVERDLMIENGEPTALFSYYSVGALRYRGDFLFDAPDVEPGKPAYIITQSNYRIITDSTIDSYFTYNHNGTLRDTLFKYADGTVEMGDIEGFEPQQMFVSLDQFGYLYNFVDIYSAEKVCVIEATYDYEGASVPELLTANVARTPAENSYRYVFELRYPGFDDFGNDTMRFMVINKDGSFNHIDEVNMGEDVQYAQSFLSTEALAPHAYTTTDNPAYMLLIKRLADGSSANVEELRISEIETADQPEGKPLLILGPEENYILKGIVPEFANATQPGRLFITYMSDDMDRYKCNVYHLPLDEDYSGVKELTANGNLSLEGTAIAADGEIKVYDLQGALIASGNGTIDLKGLQKGMYIVTADGKSFKIIR